MVRVIIIHAWESSPEEHWYREEENILREKGFEVLVPLMPNADLPKLPEWLRVIQNFEPDEETVLIGHSLGPAAILRYLETASKKVGKVILIAGFAKYSGHDATKNFVDKPFDWAKIKQMAEKFVVINQKNDPYVLMERGQEIADNLGVGLIEVEGNNHFDKMDLDLINREIV